MILSGGSGTRLWPLSTPTKPKQFLQLLGEPLFVQALRRMIGFERAGSPVVVTGTEHLHLVEAAIEVSGVDVARILVEPEGRNTAPAVIAAAATLDPAEIMVVLPADHLMAEGRGLFAAVEAAVKLARDTRLVTFGVTPSRVETGYGYIEAGGPVGGGYEVVRFTEKPDFDAASAMVSDGDHYWNSGMFVFQANVLLAEAGSLVPDLVEAVVASLGDQSGRIVRMDDRFSGLAPILIDVAIMEATSRAVVVPLDVGWTDVGSWRSLWDASVRDASGNVIVGDVTAIEVTDSYLYSTDRRVAVAGLEGVVVVDAPEGVLVVGMDASQRVKELHPGTTSG